MRCSLPWIPLLYRGQLFVFFHIPVSRVNRFVLSLCLHRPSLVAAAGYFLLSGQIGKEIPTGIQKGALKILTCSQPLEHGYTDAGWWTPQPQDNLYNLVEWPSYLSSWHGSQWTHLSPKFWTEYFRGCSVGLVVNLAPLVLSMSCCLAKVWQKSHITTADGHPSNRHSLSNLEWEADGRI